MRKPVELELQVKPRVGLPVAKVHTMEDDTGDLIEVENVAGTIELVIRPSDSKNYVMVLLSNEKAQELISLFTLAMQEPR